MSVIKQISTYPSTGRGFSPPGNFMQNIAGSFLTKKTVTFTEAQLADNSYMFGLFEAGDIIPLHLVQSVVPKNEEIQIETSLQDFDYESRPGKYKHTLRFDWDNAFHQIVETYSGTDLYIIHYDQIGNLILAEESSGVYRGVKTDGIILQKQSLFGNGSDVVYSDLDIELKYDETFKIIQVDWLPEQIDKLFVTLDLLVVDTEFIVFTVKYNGTDITTLESSDITLVDDVNGTITGIFLNYESGSYKLDNFSSSITNGCLTVNATAYLGRIRYRVQIIVPVSNNAVWGDGNNKVWGDGNNAVWGN